jgi:hypothetical protein
MSDPSISCTEWFNYFRDLLYDENSVFVDPYVENEHDFADETAQTLTLLESKYSISKLVNNKSCGPDGIPSEF